jgi:hypothetical protein
MVPGENQRKDKENIKKNIPVVQCMGEGRAGWQCAGLLQMIGG